jgi:DNA-binding transcriptional LysR family regulator
MRAERRVALQKSALKWDDLRLFLAVARHGRLVSAGRATGLDPATLGRRIGALEAALDARLFERSPHGYTPTETGRALFDHAETVESTIEAAEAELRGGGDRLKGTVRIGAPDGFANYLLIDACDALSRANPDLQVQVVALPRMFSLSKREADLAISVSPPSAGRLTVRKIADYRLHLYASRELALRLGSLSGIADLQEVRGIGYVSDMIFDRELDYYALLGRQSEPALTSNSLIMQLRWCLRGAGVCILPDFVAREHSEIVAILEGAISLRRSFYLVRHQDDARVVRINRLAEAVVEHVCAVLAGDRGDDPLRTAGG